MMSRAALATLAAEIESVRPTPEWDTVPELKRFKQEFINKEGKKIKLDFEAIVVSYKTLDSEVKFRQAKMKDLKAALEAAMLLADEQEVECSGYPVQMIAKRGSSKIDAQKLLAHGVDAMTIAECTITGDEVVYVQIGKARKD
jgi:hypothetical protein